MLAILRRRPKRLIQVCEESIDSYGLRLLVKCPPTIEEFEYEGLTWGREREITRYKRLPIPFVRWYRAEEFTAFRPAWLCRAIGEE